MYKRLPIVLIVLFFLSLSATSSVLWRVSRGSGQPVSYLFGTEHILPEYFFPDRARQALDSCDAMVCEVDIKDIAQSAGYITDRMLLTDGMTLQDIFSQEQLDSIDAVFRTIMLGVPEISVTQMMATAKPAAITLQLQMLLSQCVIGPHSGPALDGAVQQIAAESGKPVRGLETARFQIDLLFSQPVEDMAADLMEIVRDPEAFGEQLSELTDCYLAGNLQCLESIMNDATRASAFADTLIVERNRAWMSQLPEIIDSTSAFIAVGAAHLVGPEGLIALLREAGYSVEETDCSFDTILKRFSR